MFLASWATLRGGQDMFANLRRPVEIVLTGATLPTGENALQVSDSRGNQPIVVFSDATALSALNGQHWTDGNGNDVTGIYGPKSNPNKPTQSTKLLNRFNQPIQALPNLQFQYNQPNLFSQQSWYN